MAFIPCGCDSRPLTAGAAATDNAAPGSGIRAGRFDVLSAGIPALAQMDDPGYTQPGEPSQTD